MPDPDQNPPETPSPEDQEEKCGQDERAGPTSGARSAQMHRHMMIYYAPMICAILENDGATQVQKQQAAQIAIDGILRATRD